MKLVIAFTVVCLSQTSLASTQCDLVRQATQGLRVQAQEKDTQAKPADTERLASYAQILKQYGGACPRLLMVDDQDDALLVKYRDGRVKSDFFKFKDDGHLASWTRETSEGDFQVRHYEISKAPSTLEHGADQTE
jgi:hypothetical protein